MLIGFDVNLLAVLVGALAAFAVGMLWYSALFGKAWMKEMGITEADSKKYREENPSGMVVSMVGNFVATLVMVFFLSNMMVLTEVNSVAEGLQVTFWIWLGFVAMYMLNTIWWEERSFKLYLINSFASLAGMLVAGAIVAYWV